MTQQLDKMLIEALASNRQLNAEVLVADLREKLSPEVFETVARCFKAHSMSPGRSISASSMLSDSAKYANGAVVVWGSLNVDIIATLEGQLPKINENRPAKEALHAPGGKGANESVATARLGVHTELFGNVGADDLSAQCLDALGEAGVGSSNVIKLMPVCFIKRNGFSTGTALVMTAEVRLPKASVRRIVHCDYQANGKYTVAHQGANNVEDPEQVETLKRFFADESNTHYSHFLTQMEANLANTVAACSVAKAAGRVVVVKFSPFQKGQSTGFFDHNVDWLIVNEYEAPALAAELTTGGAPYDGKPVKTLAEGYQHVLTIASRTAVPTIVLITAFGSVTKDGDCFHIVNTVKPTKFGGLIGAADSFVGGLVAAACWGRPLHEALVWGHASASLCLESPEAQDSLPTLEQLKNRLETSQLPARFEGPAVELPAGSARMVEAVLKGDEAGLTAAQRDFQGMSALHLAVLVSDEILCCKLIIRYPELLEVQDCRGRVPRDIVDAKQAPNLHKLMWFYYLMSYLKEGRAADIAPACDILQEAVKPNPKDIAAKSVAGIVAEYAVAWLGQKGTLIGDCIEARLCKIEHARGNMADLLNHEAAATKETCLYASVKGRRTELAVQWQKWIKLGLESGAECPLHYMTAVATNGRNLLHAVAESNCSAVFDTIYRLMVAESEEVPTSPTRPHRSTSRVFSYQLPSPTQEALPPTAAEAISKQKDMLRQQHQMKENDKEFAVAELFYLEDKAKVPPYRLAKDPGLKKKMREKAQLQDVFLSYSHKCYRTEVDEFYQRLKNDAQLSIWMDFEIEVGSEWAVDINAQATNCKAIVIVWTPEWEASGHCTAEYRVAKKHGAAVFVVLPNEKAEIPAAGSVVFDESKKQYSYLTDKDELAQKLYETVSAHREPVQLSSVHSTAAEYTPPDVVKPDDLIIFHAEELESWVFALLDSQPLSCNAYCCRFDHEQVSRYQAEGQRAIFVYSDTGIEDRCHEPFLAFLRSWGSKPYALLTLHKVSSRQDAEYQESIHTPVACLSVTNFLGPGSEHLQDDVVSHATVHVAHLIEQLCNQASGSPADSTPNSITPVPAV